MVGFHFNLRPYVKDGDVEELSESRVSDFAKSDELRTGPLIDVVYIEEGASYVPRRFAAADKAQHAFDAVRKIASNDVNAARFCKHATVVDPEDYGKLLSPCVPDDASLKAPRVPEGNQFLRVSVKLGVGFSGEWWFRAETHAFTGALVIEQVGVGPVSVTEFKKQQVGMYGATAKIELAVGTYVISMYAAYDEAGSFGASCAADQLREKSNRGKVFQDTLLFMQLTHCNVFGWQGLTLVHFLTST